MSCWETIADYGLVPHRRPGIIGIWVGENKIAALGVRIKGGVCFHGLALNVDPFMAHWTHIIACGITDGGVTSLARELGYTPLMAEVQQHFTNHFARVFDKEIIQSNIDQLRITAENLSMSVAQGRSDQ